MTVEGVAAGSAPTATAAGGEALVASSVCEAHALKALKLEDPDVQIEIPAEFDKQWPSASACEAHELAWDDEAPGPRQPIPFSHKHHAGDFGMDCSTATPVPIAPRPRGFRPSSCAWAATRSSRGATTSSRASAP